MRDWSPHGGVPLSSAPHPPHRHSRYLVHSLPHLRQADTRPVTVSERERASRFFQTTEGKRLLTDMARQTGQGAPSRATSPRAASPQRSRTQDGPGRAGAPPVRTVARRRRRAASRASAALPPPPPARSPAPAPEEEATSIADALAMLPGGGAGRGENKGAPPTSPTVAGTGAELEIPYPPRHGSDRLRPAGRAVRVSGGEAALWWPSGKPAASTSKAGDAVALYAHHRDGSLAVRRHQPRNARKSECPLPRTPCRLTPALVRWPSTQAVSALRTTQRELWPSLGLPTARDA